MIISDEVGDAILNKYFMSNASHDTFKLKLTKQEHDAIVPENPFPHTGTYRYICLEHSDIPTGLPMCIVGYDSNSMEVALYPFTFIWFKSDGKYNFIW